MNSLPNVIEKAIASFFCAKFQYPSNIGFDKQFGNIYSELKKYSESNNLSLKKEGNLEQYLFNYYVSIKFN